MADDSLASNDTLVAPSQDGQAQQASDSQPQSSNGGQASQNGQPAQDENIKNLQRALSQKDLESKRALSEAQQAKSLAQQLQQQLRQLEDNAAPDDYSRLELQLKRAKEEAQQYAYAYQQMQQERQEQEAKHNALREVAEEFGVSVKDIEDATDYKSAVKLAIKAQQERERKRQEQDNDKRERNMPDIGGGGLNTPKSRWDAEYEEAMDRRDSVAIARLLRTRGK